MKYWCQFCYNIRINVYLKNNTIICLYCCLENIIKRTKKKRSLKTDSDNKKYSILMFLY